MTKGKREKKREGTLRCSGGCRKRGKARKKDPPGCWEGGRGEEEKTEAALEKPNIAVAAGSSHDIAAMVHGKEKARERKRGGKKRREAHEQHRQSQACRDHHQTRKKRKVDVVREREGGKGKKGKRGGIHLAAQRLSRCVFQS